jgi:hypothetical protein
MTGRLAVANQGRRSHFAHTTRVGMSGRRVMLSSIPHKAWSVPR